MIFSLLCIYIVGQLSIQSSTEEIPEQFAELVKSGSGLYVILCISGATEAVMHVWHEWQCLFSFTDFKSQVGRLQSEQFKVYVTSVSVCVCDFVSSHSPSWRMQCRPNI